MRLQHRREQANGRGLAVGTGDHGFRNAVQRRPRHCARRRQFAQRPCLRGSRLADRQSIVVMRARARHARVRLRSGQQSAGFASASASAMQLAQRFRVVEMRDMRPWLLGFVRRQARRRRASRARHTAPTRSLRLRHRAWSSGASNASDAPVAYPHTEDRAIGPTSGPRARTDVSRQRRSAASSKASRARFPAPRRGRRSWVGAGQAARILERFAHDGIAHASRLNRFLALEAQAAFVAHHAFHRRDQLLVEGGVERGHFHAARRRRACRHRA